MGREGGGGGGTLSDLGQPGTKIALAESRNEYIIRKTLSPHV